ncbi:type II toxin-antitoxin system PemK/MazF family toxin [Lacisediminimonas profundi]|uniref:type II toxin-antitoxin system PemK/MazF family toxin n=1 Tax=Lacisediminimonas profundi TaxID=2603856 RepID=UPI00124B3653|nr:type II toxin-antitoxin system PemK/MazF family toxin [Lacisediminimonas profundi]
MTRLRRGEIWLVDLNPQSFKEEPAKQGRPCLVVQTDLLNDAGHPTTIIIPGTSKVYRDRHGDGYPLRVPIGRAQGQGELTRETDLLIDQVRAISNKRFLGDQPVATISPEHLRRVQDALRVILSI